MEGYLTATTQVNEDMGVPWITKVHGRQGTKRRCMAQGRHERNAWGAQKVSCELWKEHEVLHIKGEYARIVM